VDGLVNYQFTKCPDTARNLPKAGSSDAWYR
jgi:hypothetical protein